QGDVFATSDGAGKGSVFTIKLPAIPASAVEQPATPIAQEKNKPVVSSAGKLAIIEDNDDSRRMLEMMLQLQGYHTIAAADGITGMTLILQEKPRLAFIDIGLPGLNGFELARKLRSEPTTAQLPLIAITGYGRFEDQQAAREAGFHEHLVKPLQRHELDRILQRYLSENYKD
ncbi:MAG TPA: response regulator, partial [Gemmatales bacterium]|nr:response regulator [Gemmatales bacterium]